MENLFESVIWLVIMVFFWLIPALTKKNKQPQEVRRQSYPQPPPAQPSREEREALEKKLKMLETLGFPIPKPSPSPYLKKPKPQPVVLEKKAVTEIKVSPALAAVKSGEEAFFTHFVFTVDKLQEGIILSTILGPPKSIELRAKNLKLRKLLNLSS